MCKKPGIIWTILVRMNTLSRIQMQGNPFVSFADACWVTLLGQDTTELQQAQFLQLEFIIQEKLNM